MSYELGESLFVTAFSDIPSALTGLFSLHSEAISRFATKVEQLQNADRERGFEKEKWLLMKGLAGALYESRAVPIHSSAGEGWLLTLRSALHHSITSLLPDRQTAGLTLGMLIGDRSYLSAETYDTFVQSGLVHIIAVSGGNIVLIVSLLSALLFFLPFYIRLAAVAAAVLIYALLCGFDSSVIRATTMALLSIGALFFGR